MPSRGAEQALKAISQYREDATVKWGRPEGVSPAQMAALVRRGWARTMTQEEGPRGERKVRYQLYQITDTGLRYVPIPDHRKFGYEHNQFMQDMHERLCELRGLDPSRFHAEVYLDAAWGWGELQRRKPSLRERQAMNHVPVRPAPPRFTQEELAYLAGKLAMVNDPTGQSILDKLAKMLENA